MFFRQQIPQIALLALMMVFACGSSAAPITIDFDTGSGAYSSDTFANNNTYTESGFQFQTPLAAGNHFDSGAGVGLNCCPDVLIFHELASNTVNNVITLRSLLGPFDFVGFDLVDNAAIRTFNPIVNPVMRVTASDGNSIDTPLGAAPGFIGPVNVNWTNISWVTFDIVTNSTAVGNIVMDNVRVNALPPAGVPEPMTIVLLGFGLIGLYAAGRRRVKKGSEKKFPPEVRTEDLFTPPRKTQKKGSE